MRFKNQKTWRLLSQALLFLPFIYRVGQGFAKQNDSLCMILLCCRDLQPKKQPNELAVGIFNLRRTNPIRQSGQVSQPVVATIRPCKLSTEHNDTMPLGLQPGRRSPSSELLSSDGENKGNRSWKGALPTDQANQTETDRT